MDKYILHLNENTQKAIKRYFDCEHETSTQTKRVFYGFILYKNYYKIACELNCTNDINHNAYSGYSFNDSEKLIFTYAEGDLFLDICETEEVYQQDKTKTINHYLK